MKILSLWSSVSLSADVPTDEVLIGCSDSSVIRGTKRRQLFLPQLFSEFFLGAITRPNAIE